MLEFRVNSVPLVLNPVTQASLEERHPIMDEDLKDAFTLPVQVPIRGNEAILGHVHVLALQGRVLRITGVELFDNGVPKHRGVFYVDGSTDGPDGTVSLSFSVDGFISGMAGKELRKVDFGADLTFPDQIALLTDAIARNDESYPEARYCYPMLYNPDAYGGNNKDWFKDLALYAAGTSYGITSPPTIVRYTREQAVRRELAFECIGTAPAGENPDNTPWDWRPYGRALINAWNATTMQLGMNTDATGNVAAVCPMFYGKDILIRAMRDQGLEAVGAFIDDPRTHQWIIYNNKLLDEGERADYVLATQVGSVTYVASDPNTDPDQLHWSNGFDFHLLAQDESTTPNQDPDGRWDGLSGYTIATAGEHRWKARIKVTCSTPIYLQISIVNVTTNAIVVIALQGSMTDRRNNWDFIFNSARNYTEVGDKFRIIVTPRLWGTDHSGAVGNVTFHMSECYVEIYRGSGEVVNTYGTVIKPSEHVPNITIEHLLLDVRDWFHVRIRPMPELGVVRFDYQDDILDKPPVLDLTRHVRSHVSLDHTVRVPGIRFKNPSGREENLPDLSAHIDDGSFETESELPVPVADLHKAYIRSTGQMMVSKLWDTNKYAWFSVGTLCRDAEFGDMSNPRVVAPEFAAPDMDILPGPDGGLCLMPVIRERASSGMFGVGNNDPGLYFMYYLGMQYNETGEKTYPLATGFARVQTGTALGRTALIPPLSVLYDVTDPRSHLVKFWGRWALILVTSEPFNVAIDMRPFVGEKRIPVDRYLFENQVVIFDTLPSEFTTEPGPPVVQSVRLLRLPQP